MSKITLHAGSLHPWLLTVQFPWVQIKHKWLLFIFVDSVEGPTAEIVRVQSEIAAASNRKILPGNG